MFLKLTILFSFLEGKIYGETKKNFIEAFSKYEAKNEKVILLNVDMIHSISSVRTVTMENDEIKNGSLVKYKTAKGDICTLVVKENFEELVEKLT